MREYGQVQCGFWLSADFEGLADADKLLAIYLLTGPHSNGIGCYVLPNGYIMADLKWTAEQVAERMANLVRTGFVTQFGQVVFIPKFLRWNNIANPNVFTARFGEWRALPKGDAKGLAARALLEFGQHITERNKDFRNELELASNSVGKQNPTLPNPTQPREGEAKPATVVAIRPSVDDVSAALWAGWKALPDGGGGAYLGKLIKAHGEQPVLEAVEKTLDANPADPKGYIQGLLRKAKRDGDELDELFRSAK